MPRKAYTGPNRKLLLAFDVGTTFSGISYSIMDPGQVPEIRPVTRYLGQSQVGADCKIPTEIYYDDDGNARVIGAEASREGIDDLAEDEGWTKAKWFKLHMRPRGRSNFLSPALPPLPHNKTVVRIFADFLKYLFECARAYVQETHANGTSLWDSLAENIEYVLTHPNGWEGFQQSQMREAAILAGLIDDDVAGRSRITFVTEGEASLHFCINNGLAPDALNNRDGIVVVDAGGGTIDISAYRGQDQTFHETAIPQCHFQGSIFVTLRAKAHIENHLRDTRFEDDIPHIVQRFDKGARLTFRDDSVPHYVRFGPTREFDAALGIRNGQIRLSGAAIATFFKPSISCIVKAVKEQHVFLVGGFAASDWLFKGVKDAMQKDGLQVSRPDSHVNKAVSDGAAAFFLDHYVDSRICRAHYGTNCHIIYDDKDPEHVRRKSSVQAYPPTGVPCFAQTFNSILPKNEKVQEAKEYQCRFSLHNESPEALRQFATLVSCYRGKLEEPIWINEEKESYAIVGTIRTQLDSVRIWYIETPAGWRYTCDFEVILLFGLTEELKAQVAWIDELGLEKRYEDY